MLLVFVGLTVSAASTDTSVVSYTVLPYVALSIGQADFMPQDQGLLFFPAVDAADWVRGYLDHDTPVDLTVVANTSWILTTELLSPARLIGSQGTAGQYVTLSWANRLGGEFTDLSKDSTQGPQMVSSGDRGIHQFSLWYRVDLRSLDANTAEIEGIEAVVLYTVVAD